ncbi:MAG: hypothetical protein AAGH65_08125, partial [Pseudomonadota bacterium]
QASNRRNESIQALRESLRRSPGRARAHLKLGLLQLECGEQALGLASLEQAIRLLDDTDPVLQRGTAATQAAVSLINAERMDAGVALLKAIAAQRPDEPHVQMNAGYALAKASHHEQAVGYYRRAMQIDPTSSDALIGAANGLINAGLQDQGMALYQVALDDPVHQRKAISAYLMALLYQPLVSAEDKAAAHQHWSALLIDDSSGDSMDDSIDGPPAARPSPISGSLRVAYITPDASANHPVAQFMAEVFKAHAGMGIEQHLYWNADVQPKQLDWVDPAVHQRVVFDDDDRTLRDQIRTDRIDLVIDLAGHTRANRLALFARGIGVPSASFIGYPHSTGLQGMAYLIADPVVCPPSSVHLCSETVVRLPDCFLCFAPSDQMPLPKQNRRAGPVVFGSLNHLPKLGSSTLELWASVLRAVPHSRLLLKCGPFAETRVRDRFERRLAEFGVDAERIELQGPEPFAKAMRAYDQIDIALDPLPYNGGTTSAHALWMGVPVITWLGGNFCGRMGASMNAAAGQQENTAISAEQYVARAVELAASPDQLREARMVRHEQVRQSRLCDLERYAQALADRFITMANSR